MLPGSFDDYLIKQNNKEPKNVGVDAILILSRCGSILQCKQTLTQGGRDGTVVRALAPHQCGPVGVRFLDLVSYVG